MGPTSSSELKCLLDNHLHAQAASRPFRNVAVKLIPTWIPKPIQPLTRVGRPTAPFARIGRDAAVVVGHVSKVPDCAGVRILRMLDIWRHLVEAGRVVVSAGVDRYSCALPLLAQTTIFPQNIMRPISHTFLHRC